MTTRRGDCFRSYHLCIMAKALFSPEKGFCPRQVYGSKVIFSHHCFFTGRVPKVVEMLHYRCANILKTAQSGNHLFFLLENKSFRTWTEVKVLQLDRTTLYSTELTLGLTEFYFHHWSSKPVMSQTWPTTPCWHMAVVIHPHNRRSDSLTRVKLARIALMVGVARREQLLELISKSRPYRF
jgi:hypothetical protein